MREFIIKDNSAFMLFAVKNMSIKDKQKEFFIWSKVIDSFHFDEDVVYNLVFINHPIENYIGISIKADKNILEEKMKRYSEGLAFLLVYYFPESDIRVLDQDECLCVVKNLYQINKIPANLCSMGEHFMEGSDDKMQIVFARVFNPKVILEKFYEFYSFDLRKKPNAIENRIGIKPKCDERILTVLKNAYLCYSFRIFSTVKERDEEAKKLQGEVVPRDLVFLKDFVDLMGVPESFAEKVASANSSSDMFDNPDIVLVPPEKVAEFMLGYK